MKSNSYRKFFVGIAAGVLSGAMVVSAVMPGFRMPDNASAGEEARKELITDVTNSVDGDLSKYLAASTVQKLPETVIPGTEISVILSFDTATMLDEYDARGNAGETLAEFAVSKEGKAVTARIERENKVLQNRLTNAGITYKVGTTYDTLLSGFEVIIKSDEFDNLCKTVEDKANVMVCEVYKECETQVVENEVDVYDTGIFDSSDSEYDGSGTVVAVLDTGLDYTHSAFDPKNFTSKTLAFTRDTINGVINKLAAAQTTPGLTVSNVYINDKVPYAYDYADKDADVFPINSEHGTHVAGIIAGKDEEGKADGITGVAPNAQLAIMKVFSEREGGAKQSWLVAALEDCVTLGVDVINMSLGSSCGFSRETDEDQRAEVYEKVKERGISLVAAASNDGNSVGNSEKNGNLGLTSNPDTATVGSPSTYDSSLSVASISGVKTPYLKFHDSIIYFTESSDRASEPKYFVEEILGPDEEEKTFEYVLIMGVGRETDYQDYMNGELNGKIALVRRGQTNFEEKAKIAQKYGAAGCIIYNNVSGDIRMTVGNTDFPVCSVSRDDGERLAATPQEERRITISRKQTAGPFMSDFSSWGPTPNLGIKPEITAHGGDIYSAVPGQRYDRLSGTSMACPNQAGVTALVRQYVKEHLASFGITTEANSVETSVAVTATVNQLMMSTADIANNMNGLPFSVRKQGAGLTNLKSATSTPAYLRTYDKSDEIMDKAKLELGDDPDELGVYTFKFDLVNISNTSLTYDLDALVMTEGVSEQLTIKGDYTVTEKGYLLDGAKINATNAEGNGSVSNNVLTVNANGVLTVTAEITLSDKDRNYLEASFANGMYVEGYVKLLAKSGTEYSLNVPYLAYYGDWTRAPLFDIDYFETGRDELDDSIDYEDKIMPDAYATRPIGGLYDDYIVYLGSFAYVQDPYSTNIIGPEREHIALSNQEGEGGGVNSINNIYMGMLRSAKRIVITVTDTVTGEVIYEKTEYNQRKSYNYSGAGPGPSALDVDFRVNDYDLRNNTKYMVTVKGYLDYGEDGGSETNLNNVFEFPFYTDFEAPIITGVEYTYEYDKDAQKNKLYANVTIFDNHYVQGYMPGRIAMNEPGARYRYSLEGFGRYITPVSGGFNTTNVVKVELTDYLDEILNGSHNQNSFLMQIMDYAGNTAIYELEVPDTVMSITFPEMAETDPETNEPVGIKISPNQTYNLKPTIFPAQDEAWMESIDYTSSDEDVVRIANGKLVGVSAGTATVTATAHRDKKVTGTLKVTVLGENDPGWRRYDNPVAESFTLTGYEVNKVYYMMSNDERDLGADFVYPDNDPEYGSKRFIDFMGRYSLKMFPSESVTVKYELTNYFKSDLYKVEFISNNPNIVEVTTDGVVTAKNVDASGKPLNAERSTTISVRVLMKDPTTGEYKNTVFSQSIYVTVKEIYKTNGPYLMNYWGLGGTVEIPEEFGVTTIYQYAFSNMQYIPKDLSAGDVIDDEDPYYSKPWYLGDDTIEEVIIPEGVETIEMFAFAGLSRLRKVSFPSTLTKINTGAFYDCGSLQTVEFRGKNNLQFINQDAFYNCKLLTSFDFSSIIAFGDRAFEGSGLMNITLPASAQSIGAYAFVNNTTLMNVKIGADKVKIGEGAFAGCTQLTAVNLNTSFMSASVFEGDSKLTTITIGKDVEDVGQFAFRGTGITTFAVEPGNQYFDVTEDGKALVEKDTKRLVLVAPKTTRLTSSTDIKTIGTGAFSACETINSVNLTQVTEVEDYGFAGCRSLSTLTLGKLKRVGSYGFYGVPMRTAPQLEDGVVIGDFAFCGLIYGTNANNLTVYEPQFQAISIPDDAQIGANAFSINDKLRTVTIGNNAKIGNSAFYNAIYVSSVTIGNNAEIGEGAFGGIAYSSMTQSYAVSNEDIDFQGQIAQPYYDPYVSLLSTLSIGDNATIGDYAFVGAGSYSQLGGSLTTVSLGKDAYIGNYAFFGCANLTSIDLSTVTHIGDYAFGGEYQQFLPVNVGTQTEPEIELFFYGLEKFAPKLTNVTLSKAEYIGEGAFASSTTLTNVTLNPAIKEIKAHTFRDCTALNTIGLENIEVIGNHAFAGTSFANVTLKEGAKLGNYVFYGNKMLATVGNLDKIVSIGDYAFSGTALTEAELDAAEHIGSFAFADSGVKKVVLGDGLKTIGENPFANCEIPAFSKNGDGETFDFELESGVKVAEGVLYRPCANGLELVCYPLGKTDKTFKIQAGTVRIGEKAFYGADVVSVELSLELGAIGASAFENCMNLSVVVFKSIQAPILEEKYDAVRASGTDYVPFTTVGGRETYGTKSMEEHVGYYLLAYTDGSEDKAGLGIVPYISWTADPTNILYGANFVAPIGTKAGAEMHDKITLIMVCPANGSGYDSFTYDRYFDLAIAGANAPMKSTTELVARIEKLRDVVVTAENLAEVEKEAAEIRNIFNTLNLEQQALVTNLDVLQNAESQIDFVKQSQAHTHVDADNDGKCDSCGEDMEHEHADADNDGKCDICGEDMPQKSNLGAILGICCTAGALILILAIVMIVTVVKKKKSKRNE